MIISKKIKSHVKVNLNRDKESLKNLNLNLLQRIIFFVHGTIPKPTRTITSTKITSSMPMLGSAKIKKKIT
jgi:hypothetical protein